MEKRIPSFWVSEEYSGCTLGEFVSFALRTRDRQRFDLAMHRGGGWKGPGFCTTPACEVCPLLRRLGV